MVARSKGQLKPWLENSLKVWIGSNSRDPPPFSNRLAVDLFDVSGEIDRWGAGDGATDSKGIHWSTPISEKSNTGWVDTTADYNPNVVKAGLIKPGTNFTDQFRSDPSALGRCIKAYCPQTLPESTGNAKALFCFVLERVDKSDSFDLGIDVSVERADCLHGVSNAQDEGVWDCSRGSNAG